MPIQLTEDMKKYINNARAENSPCLLATASKDGWPSLGYRGSMMAFDDTHLAYWERSRKDGLAHILENPNVLVWYRNADPQLRLLWKFFGRAKIHESGSIRDEVMRRRVPGEVTADPEGKGVAVLIELDGVIDGAGKVVMARDGAKVPGVL